MKPSKDNLVVYEVLIRDFDSNRNIQNLIDKIDYFKNLKINAIELMPIMDLGVIILLSIWLWINIMAPKIK